MQRIFTTKLQSLSPVAGALENALQSLSPVAGALENALRMMNAY